MLYPVTNTKPHYIEQVSGINYTTGMHSYSRNALYISQDVGEISDGCLSIITEAMTRIDQLSMPGNCEYLGPSQARLFIGY